MLPHVRLRRPEPDREPVIRLPQEHHSIEHSADLPVLPSAVPSCPLGLRRTAASSRWSCAWRPASTLALAPWGATLTTAAPAPSPPSATPEKAAVTSRSLSPSCPPSMAAPSSTAEASTCRCALAPDAVRWRLTPCADRPAASVARRSSQRTVRSSEESPLRRHPTAPCPLASASPSGCPAAGFDRRGGGCRGG